MTLGTINRNAIRETRKVSVQDPAGLIEHCPVCAKQGAQHHLRFFHVNINEAVYKCNSSTCLYPFRNFIYKNFTDNTVYRYERISLTPTLGVQHESQIVPHATGDILQQSADYYNDNTLHAHDFRASITDDTTQSSSDSYSTGSYENYSLDMFSLENLLALSSSDGDAKVTPSSSNSSSIDNDAAAFGMDCIDDIIDDICNTSDYNTETDFDCSDLAKYIDGSPTKSREFVLDTSPVRIKPQKLGVTLSFAPNEPPTSTNRNANKPILISSVTLPNKFVATTTNVNTVHLPKPISSGVQTATTNTAKRKVAENKTKKSRQRKDTSQTEFKELLRKNCDVKQKYQALVENKEKFRPLDLLHSFYSMKLNTGRTGVAKPRSVRQPKPAFPTFHPASCNRILVKEEYPQPSLNNGRVDEFNETDIKQNIIYIQPKIDGPNEMERKPDVVDIKADSGVLPYKRKQYVRMKSQIVPAVTRVVFPGGNVQILQ